jgi:hypothetical protein
VLIRLKMQYILIVFIYKASSAFTDKIDLRQDIIRYARLSTNPV